MRGNQTKLAQHFGQAWYAEKRMGRQTAVALSPDDERNFLAFLRTGADIRVLRWYAPSPELLFTIGSRDAATLSSYCDGLKSHSLT
jgi:hypothetical protein